MKFNIKLPKREKSDSSVKTTAPPASSSKTQETVQPKVTLNLKTVPKGNPLEASNLPEELTRFSTLSGIKSHNEDEVYTAIVKDPAAKGGQRYLVIEPTLTNKDKENFTQIKRILMVELTADLSEISDKKKAEERLKKKIIDIIETYKLEVNPRSVKKLIYYAIRDFIKLGKIDVLMQDPMIEEVSCDGTGIPLYIWHREHESMPTNITFETDKELMDFALKLAYIAHKHISVANPIIDSSLPDGSRINLTYGSEITKKGSTFTIRKFKGDPITIVDLVKYNTMSSDEAAYLWYLVQKRLTMLVAGGTASGKTTTLNALSAFITPGQKIVTIEDTAELNLSHENWIPAVSRQAFTTGQIGEITQFDLLRAALRQRPDIIIVGETRGQEAHTLFQAMATGHGGFSSIHADSVSATITRLTSAPMEVPKLLIINTLDAILLQLKLQIGNKSVRRVIQISEIAGYDDKTGEILLNDAFRWNPSTDRHVFTGKSVMFDKIANRFGEPIDQITYELNKRKTILEWMVRNDIRGHKEVNKTIQEFYNSPDRFYERIRILT
jgi:flagellar protein FlaI